VALERLAAAGGEVGDEGDYDGEQEDWSSSDDEGQREES
jgi:hypothetical protein